MGPWRSALYSDAGFGVLTLILERLTGQEYKDAIKDIIFTPLGMNSSSAVVPNGTDVDAVARTGLVSWGTDVASKLKRSVVPDVRLIRNLRDKVVGEKQ